MAVKGFSYIQQEYRFIAHYKDGAWNEGSLTDNPILPVHESSTAINYGQQCFEGLKAYTTESGKVVLFRPELNAKRINESCERLLMPGVCEEMFVNACIEVVKANIKSVPEFGSGGSLYLRPMVIGIGENLGVKPAPEYLFVVYCSPVGAYFADGFKPVKFCTTEYDRAARHGTGKAKVGGNYSASMLPHKQLDEKMKTIGRKNRKK